jgi:SP family galactose:H+ symporter-like MFS transporter
LACLFFLQQSILAGREKTAYLDPFISRCWPRSDHIKPRRGPLLAKASPPGHWDHLPKRRLETARPRPNIRNRERPGEAVMGMAITGAHNAAARSNSTFTAGMAALAGLMFGLDIGVISGALKFIGAEFHASDFAKEWIVSSMMIGAAAGAIAAGFLSYRLGRKISLILSAALFVAGSLACAFAWSIPSLIAARLVLGVAIGIATFTAPLYIAEIAPPDRRGSMVSTYQLMMAIPGILFLGGVLLLPQSPRWLMMRGQQTKAREILSTLRNSEQDVSAEIADIETQLQRPDAGWALLKTNPNFRRSLGLGLLLQAIQQFTGINVVMYYAPRIFEATGFGTQAALWGTAIVGLMNVMATFIAIGTVDRLGRRPVLICGFSVMTVALILLGVLLDIGTNDLLMQMAAVAMLLIFIGGFAMSAGPLIWVLCSEVQPTRGRDFGVSASTFMNWAANFIVGLTFLSLLNAIGTGATFWLYAALNALFIVLTLWLVPETKGVSLETIETNLMAGKKLRHIGQ